MDIIKKQTGVVLTEDDLEIKSGIILFKGSVGVKNKIFINKEKILLEINKATKIVDIK